MDIYEEYGLEDEYDEKTLAADGWTIETNEYDEKVYRLQVNLQESDIPFSRSIGSGWVKIDRNFVLSTGISVGDADAGSEADFELPRLNGSIIPFSPITISCNGGDYAGGYWSFYVEIEMTVF